MLTPTLNFRAAGKFCPKFKNYTGLEVVLRNVICTFVQVRESRPFFDETSRDQETRIFSSYHTFFISIHC